MRASAALSAGRLPWMSVMTATALGSAFMSPFLSLARQREQGGLPGGRLLVPGHLPGAGGEMVGCALYVALLQSGAAAQQRVCCAAFRQRGVDHPAKGLDASAAQVVLEACGLGKRCRLRERDDQYAGVIWVSKSSEQSPNRLRNIPGGALDLALVALRGVEQEQGVAGRRGIEHDDRIPCRVDSASEGAEHRDLLGAGRAHVLFQQRTAIVIEPWG